MFLFELNLHQGSAKSLTDYVRSVAPLPVGLADTLHSVPVIQDAVMLVQFTSI